MTKIIELIKSYDKPNSILEYPVLISWYPISLIVNDTIEERIIQYLKETIYTKQPATIRYTSLDSKWSPYDWVTITLNFHAHKIICVSEKVWNDSAFREIIIEYLI